MISATALMFLASVILKHVVGQSWSYLNMTKPPDYWELPRMMGIMKWQMLRVAVLKDHPNKWHTCYNVRCEGNQCPWETDPTNTIEFCYPAVIVTGMPKCGTSAMYNLLSRYSGTITMFEKENCPYTRRRSHWEYFNTLPKAGKVRPGQLIIDGCIDTQKNLMLRKIMREPNTVYIVMTRNYADMLWSAYNFWCKVQYDGYECDSNTKWVKAQYHHRSAQAFHDIVLRDKNNTLGPFDSPLHDTMKRPCANAGGYFSEYLQFVLWRDIGGKFSTRATDAQHTLVIASEDLEKDPFAVWQRVRTRIGITDEHGSLNLGNFSDYRTNAQDATSMTTDQQHGDKTFVPLNKYRPGRFNISHFEPMFDSTRKLLDECWIEDCKFISKQSGHAYEVCAGSQ